MSSELEKTVIKIAKDVEYIKSSIETTNKELYGNGKPGLKTRLQSVEFVVGIIKWVGVTCLGTSLTVYVAHIIK